jgi:hypothetical protein
VVCCLVKRMIRSVERSRPSQNTTTGHAGTGGAVSSKPTPEKVEGDLGQDKEDEG